MDWLSGGGRSRGLSLRDIGSLLRGPSPLLVSLENVDPRLNASQTGPVADVHLLWSHFLAAGAMEARAAHTGMRSAAGATVLAGGLAVS